MGDDVIKAMSSNVSLSEGNYGLFLRHYRDHNFSR